MVDPTRQAVGGNRRRATRAPIRLEAAYEDADRQVFLTTSDISELGIYLLSPELPPVGEAARVTLELPGNPALLRLSGTVVRQHTSEPTGFALQFDPDALSEKLRSHVRHYVSSYASSSG